MEVRPIGGLCNRLRVIGSRLVAARATGQTLTVWWFVHSACPTLFGDLFEAPPADLIVRDGEVGPRDVETTCSVFTGSDEAVWGPVILEALRPLPAIQARIDGLLALAGPDFTAVHIRRTDHNARYEEDSAYADFAAATPDVKVYVSADNPRSIATVKRALGDRVIYGADFRQTGIRLTGVADAVVDIWVAGKAARFKGTFYSSFSEWIEMMRRYSGLAAGDLRKITTIE
jgi:hypothetical protein